MNNPSLREEPRHRPAAVIPLKQEFSLLDWLENTGRLIARDAHDPDGYLNDEDVEISELMSVEEGTYDLDDDDMDDDMEDLDE